MTSTADSILDEVLSERLRQISHHGYTAERDDGYRRGELALAAAVLALPCYSEADGDALVDAWVFINLHATLEHLCDFKLRLDDDRRLCLIKAMALLAAEVEAIDRREARRG